MQKTEIKMKLSLELLFSNLYETNSVLADKVRVVSPDGIDFSQKKISGFNFLTKSRASMSKEAVWFWAFERKIDLEPECLDGLVIVTTKASESEKLVDNNCILFIFPSAEDVLTVFNNLSDNFSAISDWETQMDLLVSQHASVQEMLDITEPIIRNPIFIWDCSFNIVGRPTMDVSELSIWKKWLKDGKITGEGVAQFAKLGYFNDMNKYNSISYTTPVIAEAPFVLRVFASGSRQELVLAQYFTKVSVSLAQMELLSIFENKLEKYVFNIVQQKQLQEKKKIYEPFIIDLIENRYSDSEIKDKLKYIRLPYNARYKVYAISFEHYSRPLVAYINREIKLIAPTGHAVELNNIIYILTRDESARKEDVQRRSEILHNILENSSCFCGISNEISDLSQVCMAASQALAAIRMGATMEPNQRCWSYNDMYFYDVCFNYYEQKTGGLESLIHPGIYRIIEDDNKTGQNNLQMLEIYLNRDRNLTDTAKETFIHRNSVIYRIEKIEKIIGDSFDNPVVRFNLLVSLKCLKLREAINKMSKDHEI